MGPQLMAKDPRKPKLSNPKNYFKLVQDTMKKILKWVFGVLILNTYLNILGLEMSQSVKYQSSLSLSYDVLEVPRLLPVH